MSAFQTMLWALALLVGQAQATPYSTAVLADGPVGYWQFENAPAAGGTAIDTAGGDHNGTYVAVDDSGFGLTNPDNSS